MFVPNEWIEQMVRFVSLEQMRTRLGRLGAAGVERLLGMPVLTSGGGIGCRYTVRALSPASFYPTTQGS